MTRAAGARQTRNLVDAWRWSRGGWFCLVALLAACGGLEGERPILHTLPDEGPVEPVVLFGSKDERHVAVGVLHTRLDGQQEGMCSATLIGPRVLLTAAHCVVNLDQEAFAREEFALHQATDVFFYPVGADAVYSPATRAFRGTAIAHPLFLDKMRAIEDDASTFTAERTRDIVADFFFHHDIALVILHEEPLLQGPAGTLRMAPTPVAHASYPAVAGLALGLQWSGLPVTMVGFGGGSRDSFGTRRRGSNRVRYVGEADFQGYLGGWAQRGDSGGPVLFEQDASGVAVQVGIIVKGLTVIWDIYQRVDVYLPWLLDTVRAYGLQVAVASDSGISLAP